MRVLIASQPIAGHVLPLREVARELGARGHELRWYTGRKYRPQAEGVGAEWEPLVHARDYDDADFGAAFPGREALAGRWGGLAQLLFDIQNVFVGQIEGQFHDLRAIERRWAPDVVLADQTVGAALLREELGGPPTALLGVLPLGIPDPDTAPFGLGLPPRPGPLGALRNRALYGLSGGLLFRGVSAQLAGVTGRLGAAPRSFAPPVAPGLMLQPSVPAFEYPRRSAPPQLRFIGPILPRPANFTPPAWWEEVTQGGRPVMLVTQGTLATQPEQLILPALKALAGENLSVVVAGADPAGLGRLPANAHAAAFVPFSELLPHVQLYLTNGGYGGTLQALSHGVPCVVAGGSEDKAEVAARVAYSGVGLNLRTPTPTPAALRRAVERVLGEPGFRERAEALAAELNAHRAPAEAADWLEHLARASARTRAYESGAGTAPSGGEA